MKKLPLGERAIAAIIRYESAAAELTKIKKGIVAEPESCPITIEAYQGNDIHGGFVDISKADEKRLWDGSRVRHHLHEVLQVTTDDGGDYDRERKLHDHEIRAELEGLGYDDDQPYACPQCLAAWTLIEQRKVARQEFGTAKRAIRALGKTAIKVMP